MTTLVTVVAACVAIGCVVTAIADWSEAEVDRHVARALRPLPDTEATDADFEGWARQALGIANSPAFEDEVLADINALPTTKERSA